MCSGISYEPQISRNWSWHAPRPISAWDSGTLGESHGTKFFRPKIFSCHPLMKLFYAFCGFIWTKWVKNGRNGYFHNICLILGFSVTFGGFPNFAPISSEWIYKMHEITSLEDGKRKFLDQKIWSHGTPLGYQGPESWADLGLGAWPVSICLKLLCLNLRLIVPDSVIGLFVLILKVLSFKTNSLSALYRPICLNSNVLLNFLRLLTTINLAILYCLQLSI